jgi:hypothetical protein
MIVLQSSPQPIRVVSAWRCREVGYRGRGFLDEVCPACDSRGLSVIASEEAFVICRHCGRVYGQHDRN